MEFLSSIVFHTDLFIPCNIYVFCQNVDAPPIYRYYIWSILSSIVFHTGLFIPCNIYVFCQNVDAPTI